MGNKIKIAFLTTDNREQFKDYNAPKPYFGTAPEALLRGFSGMPDLEIHVVCCVRTKVPSPAKIADNIFYHSLVVSSLGWGRTLFLGCAFAVRKLLGKIQPDIVHGQGTERDCAMSAVLSGYPNLITIHGVMRAVAKANTAAPKFYFSIITKLERFAVGRTQGVLCNSNYTESQISPYTRKTWRVPNCVRSDFFAPQPAIANRKCRIVVLGGIMPYKQPLEILEMWKNLEGKSAHAEIVFIGRCGDNDYGRSFQQLLASPELNGRARHIPWLDLKDLIQFLDTARGMIHFPTEESFGLAVAEGLARNLKLFAARTGGIPDVATGCLGVEFFLPYDWSGLANSVIKWIDEECPIFDSASIIEENFSPASVAQRHIEIYSEILSGATV